MGQTSAASHDGGEVVKWVCVASNPEHTQRTAAHSSAQQRTAAHSSAQLHGSPFRIFWRSHPCQGTSFFVDGFSRPRVLFSGCKTQQWRCVATDDNHNQALPENNAWQYYNIRVFVSSRCGVVVVACAHPHGQDSDSCVQRVCLALGSGGLFGSLVGAGVSAARRTFMLTHLIAISLSINRL